MIDIHSHVLPKIDDGPTTWEETLDMMRQAEEDGITEVAITHHILSNLDYEREGEIITKYKELRQRLAMEKINVTIHLGAEIYSQADMELFHTISTYNNNKKYFLIEFPMQGIPRFVADRFFELITEGMTPIIAHPERNIGVIRKPERAYEFVQRGALLQTNAGSILGRHGSPVKDTATILLNSNLVHFVGTDAHNTKRRPMQLRDAYEAVRDGWGEDRAKMLFFENPQRAIAGQPIQPPEPQPVEPLSKGLSKLIKKMFK
ncbi:MAG: tyrosine-protein phosphatase [bacterium]